MSEKVKIVVSAEDRISAKTGAVNSTLAQLETIAEGVAAAKALDTLGKLLSLKPEPEAHLLQDPELKGDRC